MPYIDKSNYLRGLQCPKLLWHSFNRREAIPPRRMPALVRRAILVYINNN